MMFQCHHITIRLIWKRWLDPSVSGKGVFKVQSLLKSKCGRKKVYDPQELGSRIPQFPYSKRTTIRDHDKDKILFILSLARNPLKEPTKTSASLEPPCSLLLLLVPGKPLFFFYLTKLLAFNI
jgi:hypothetical protein